METKWNQTAQKAWKAILEKINDLKTSQGYSDEKIAELIGVGNRSVVSEWRKGNRSAEHTSFANLMNYLENLGFNYADFFPPEVPTIKRVGPNAPVEKVEGEDLPSIPVLGHTGAGNAVELFSQVAEVWLPVLPQYFRTGMIGLVVDGTSMEPTIHKGAVVGIMPYDGSINDGGIYLVQMPPFGRTIKRIRMGDEGKIELCSDNPIFKPVIVAPEGYEGIISGRIVWIWQGC